jgi:hypothetical protein
MELVDIAQRFWADLMSRPNGPFGFRFLLQPAMATAAALFDGLLDARAGRVPYLWSLLHEPATRLARLREGIASVGRLLLLGATMEVVYQGWQFGTFYPVEALLVVFTLCFLPYLLLRGPATRIARRWLRA